MLTTSLHDSCARKISDKLDKFAILLFITEKKEIDVHLYQSVILKLHCTAALDMDLFKKAVLMPRHHPDKLMQNTWQWGPMCVYFKSSLSDSNVQPGFRNPDLYTAS